MPLHAYGFGLTDTGKKRSSNQDHFTIIDSQQLFLVCDGMGGHNGGETASKIAVEKISEIIQRTPHPNSDLLKEAFLAANQSIIEKGDSTPELKGMGTTATAILLCEPSVFIAQVGDSRAYLIQEQGIWQLSQDHSLIQEKVRAGVLTREEAKTAKNKNVITRCLGYDSSLEVDIYEYKATTGDLFLICSDGLTGLVTDSKIYEIISQTKTQDFSLEATAKKLIQTALDNGGDDNVTVILAEVRTTK